MEPRNEDVIRLYKLKEAKNAPGPRISEESPKEKVSIGRRIKEKAKRIGKNVIKLGILGGLAVGAHYLAKNRSERYANIAKNLVEPQFKAIASTLVSQPRKLIPKAMAIIHRSMKENLALAAAAVGDAMLSNYELYRKYIHPWIREFVIWAMAHAKIIAWFFGFWMSGGPAVKAISSLVLLVHTVAYFYEEDYRDWFNALGLEGAVIAAIQAGCEKVPIALRQLVEWFKQGYHFVKDTISKLTELFKEKGGKLARSAYKWGFDVPITVLGSPFLLANSVLNKVGLLHQRKVDNVFTPVQENWRRALQ